MRTISCVESCEYLAGEQYQSGRRQEKSRSGGKKFLEEMGELFSSRENLYTFAIMLHADIFAFSRVYGPVNDRRVLRALEGLKGLLSPILVPGGEPDRLTSYVHHQVENSRRYRSSPGLGKKDQVRALEGLIRNIRERENGGGGESTSYFEEFAQLFGPMDLSRDLGFTEEDLKVLQEQGGAHRTEGGIILPG